MEWRKVWGCWAGEARPTPPISCLTTLISKEHHLEIPAARMYNDSR